MRHLPLLILALTLTACASSTKTDDAPNKPRLVEAACGQCKFDMPGAGCDLAVRFDGQAYFVDGTSIDDHGDAHAADGFCSAIRQAKVQGQLVGDRFAVTTFELLPQK
ncbi:MAG: DUF6370 family protein [Planctomycetota bacterium]|jgi:hypothetical protein